MILRHPGPLTPLLHLAILVFIPTPMLAGGLIPRGYTTSGSAPIDIPRRVSADYGSSGGSSGYSVLSNYLPNILHCGGELPLPDFYGWPKHYSTKDYRNVDDLCAYKPVPWGQRYTTVGTICLDPSAERTSQVCDRDRADVWLWESEPLRRFCLTACWCAEESEDVRQARLRYAHKLGHTVRPEGHRWGEMDVVGGSSSTSPDAQRRRQSAEFNRHLRALDAEWLGLTRPYEQPSPFCPQGPRGQRCRTRNQVLRRLPFQRAQLTDQTAAQEAGDSAMAASPAAPLNPTPPEPIAATPAAIASSSPMDIDTQAGGSCGARCEHREDGSIGCASSVQAACACAAVMVATNLWETGGCRSRGSMNFGGKRKRSVEDRQVPAEEGFPCPCNSTYVSHGCCGSLNGLVWEGHDEWLGLLKISG